MSEPERGEQEQEVGATPVSSSESKGHHRAYSKINRELSEKEPASPGATRLLIDELDRLQREVDALATFREKFYEADKQQAVLHERLTAVARIDLLFTVSLTIGAALIGITPAIWQQKGYAWMVLAVGILLIIGGIVARLKA